MAADYRTARLGKWHLGDDTQGVDSNSANGKGGPTRIAFGDVYVAMQLIVRAIEFIEGSRNGLFFRCLTRWDMHVPHRAR